MEMKVQLVLHRTHGGFSLTREIVDRLRERRVPWIGRLGDGGDRWYLPSDGEDLRRDQDLVDVVREIEFEMSEASKRLDWRARELLERQLLDGLRAVTVTVAIDVEDYDGLETVRVRGGIW